MADGGGQGAAVSTPTPARLQAGPFQAQALEGLPRLEGEWALTGSEAPAGRQTRLRRVRQPRREPPFHVVEEGIAGQAHQRVGRHRKDRALTTRTEQTEPDDWRPT